VKPVSTLLTSNHSFLSIVWKTASTKDRDSYVFWPSWPYNTRREGRQVSFFHTIEVMCSHFGLLIDKCCRIITKSKISRICKKSEQGREHCHSEQAYKQAYLKKTCWPNEVAPGRVAANFRTYCRGPNISEGNCYYFTFFGLGGSTFLGGPDIT
jgi:hypothetical protein